MKKIVTLFLFSLMAFFANLQAKVVYMATDGSDSSAGTVDAPLATLPAAYHQIASGDTICVRGGRYAITDEQVMKTDRNYAFVFALEKGGSPSHRTCLMGYPGERPVFDCSALQLDGQHRFSVFYLGADYLHLRNFNIVGVPVRVKGHTQSECVSARKGSHCIVENNSFAPSETTVAVSAEQFVSLDPASLFLPRDADGYLPEMTFLLAKPGSLLAERKMGWHE